MEDTAHPLGLDLDNLPPTARKAITETRERLEAGEDPASVLADFGVSEEETRRILTGIREASQEERVALRANLTVGASWLVWLENWLRSGEASADWGIIMLPLDFSEGDRLDALRRILERMDGPPVHPAKWRQNRDALVTALEDMGVRVEQLAEARGWEAVREAVGHLTPHETREQTPEVVRSFRSALERLVGEDLLGPGWRKKTVQEAVPLDPSVLGPVEDEMFAAIDTRREVDALLDGADLTAGERDVLELARDGYENREIAERLGRTYDAVRRARSDGIRKIRDTLP